MLVSELLLNTQYLFNMQTERHTWVNNIFFFDQNFGALIWRGELIFCNLVFPTQQVFTCSKSVIETLKRDVKYDQS